jgi:metal-sulfur cluster biosynthetic enzyme
MKEKVLAALKTVKDLELGINVVDLGLIYRVVEVKDGVKIAMSMTTPLCPYLSQMLEQVRVAAQTVPGVAKAEVRLVWSPPWNPRMMSEGARAELGIL